MACFIKSENNSAKGILNLLEYSHIVFIHTIKLRIAVVNCSKAAFIKKMPINKSAQLVSQHLILVNL